jgi:hypothetical protein
LVYYRHNNGRKIVSDEASYRGAVYPLADATATSALKDAVSSVFSDGGRGGFVGLSAVRRSPHRIRVPPSSRIALPRCFPNA